LPFCRREAYLKTGAYLKTRGKKVRGPEPITSRRHMGHPEPEIFRKDASLKRFCHLPGRKQHQNPENLFLNRQCSSAAIPQAAGALQEQKALDTKNPGLQKNQTRSPNKLWV